MKPNSLSYQWENSGTKRLVAYQRQRESAQGKTWRLCEHTRVPGEPAFQQSNWEEVTVFVYLPSKNQMTFIINRKEELENSVIINDLMHTFSLKWIYFPSLLPPLGWHTLTRRLFCLSQERSVNYAEFTSDASWARSVAGWIMQAHSITDMHRDTDGQSWRGGRDLPAWASQPQSADPEPASNATFLLRDGVYVWSPPTPQLLLPCSERGPMTGAPALLGRTWRRKLERQEGTL